MANENEKYDLAIIGAGPAGIEGLLQASKKGLKAILVEREDAGAVVWRSMRAKVFHHTYGRNNAPPRGLLYFPDRVTGEDLVTNWRNQILPFAYMKETVLLSVAGSAGDFILKTDKGDLRASKIILSSGTLTRPRKLGVAGEDGNENIKHELDYRFIPILKNVLVVGGGNSAVETALECALDNKVTLLVRESGLSSNVTERNKKEFETSHAGERLTVFFGSEIEKIEGNKTLVKIGMEERGIMFDRLYIHVGYERPEDWLRSLQIEVDDHGFPKKNSILESSRPGIFVAGSIAGSDSIIESANHAIEIVASL